MKKTIIKGLKTILFFGVGFLILYLVFNNQQEAYLAECELQGITASDCSLVQKVIDDFSSANFWILGLTVILFMISNIFRAYRWHLLLEPLGYHPKLYNSLGATMIGYLLNLSVPRAGEIAKPATLTKYEEIPLDISIGTIVTDRIIDVVCLLLVFLLTIILAYDRIIDYLVHNIPIDQYTQTITENPLLLIVLLLFFAISVFFLWKFKSKIRKNRFVNKIIEFGLGVWKGTLSILKMKRWKEFVFYSIGIWTMYFLMTYITFFAFGPTAHLSATAGLVVFLFGSLGIVIPSPGGMGSYHFLIGQALWLYGVSGIDGFSFANIAFFTIQIFGNILFGGLALILLPILNKEKSPQHVVPR